MAYLVSQMRKQAGINYMQNVSVEGTTIVSPNPFGGGTNFTDFALMRPVPAGSTTKLYFEAGQVYYLRFTIHKIPQYFYSGSKTESEVQTYMADADTLNLQIILKNDEENDQETNPPEVVGTCVVNTADKEKSNDYTSYSFVFSPTKNFDRLGFRINRTSFDAVYASSTPRNWLIDSQTDVTKEVFTSDGTKITVSTEGTRVYFGNSITGETDAQSKGDFCSLNNLTAYSKSSSWLRFGYQCRPGSLIVVNGEPIRLGRSGIYEINNGTRINSFMIASPNGSDSAYIDAFLLDYAYKN